MYHDLPRLYKRAKTMAEVRLATGRGLEGSFKLDPEDYARLEQIAATYPGGPIPIEQALHRITLLCLDKIEEAGWQRFFDIMDAPLVPASAPLTPTEAFEKVLAPALRKAEQIGIARFIAFIGPH
jgi:hypothetical protein